MAWNPPFLQNERETVKDCFSHVVNETHEGELEYSLKIGILPVSSEISDLLLLVSYFSSQNKGTKFGDCVLCKLKLFG